MLGAHRYVKKQSEETSDLFEGEKKGTREKGFDKGQSKRIWGSCTKLLILQMLSFRSVFAMPASQHCGS